jgi:hypothetical protein
MAKTKKKTNLLKQADPTELDAAKRSELLAQEKIIAGGFDTFVEVGLAMIKINQEELFRAAGHRTFAAYYRERWGYEKSYVSRLMEGAKIGEKALEVLPELKGRLNESHVREVASLVTYDDEGTPDCGKAIKVLKEVAKKLDDGQPFTVKAIREVTPRKRMPVPEILPAELVLKDASEAREAVTRIIEHLDQLHSSMKHLLPKENAREVGRHFKIVLDWAENLGLWLEKQPTKV